MLCAMATQHSEAPPPTEAERRALRRRQLRGQVADGRPLTAEEQREFAELVRGMIRESKPERGARRAWPPGS